MKRFSIVPTKQFRKDLRRLAKSKANLQKLQKVIDLLASGAELPTQYRDHELRGSLRGVRECHVGPDWLLLYSKDEGQLILLLVRTGTHRDVLGIE